MKKEYRLMVAHKARNPQPHATCLSPNLENFRNAFILTTKKPRFETPEKTYSAKTRSQGVHHHRLLPPKSKPRKATTMATETR